MIWSVYDWVKILAFIGWFSEPFIHKFIHIRFYMMNGKIEDKNKVLC